LEAIYVLATMGPSHDADKRKLVLDALKESCRESNECIRLTALAAVMIWEKKGDEKNLETIAAFLKDGRVWVRQRAIMALGALGSMARKHAADLVRLLQQKEDMWTQKLACEALGRIGDRSEATVSALIKLTRRVDRESVGVVVSACMALEKLGAANRETAEALNKIRKQREEDAKKEDEWMKRLLEIGRKRGGKKP